MRNPDRVSYLPRVRRVPAQVLSEHRQVLQDQVYPPDCDIIPEYGIGSFSHALWNAERSRRSVCISLREHDR